VGDHFGSGLLLLLLFGAAIGGLVGACVHPLVGRREAPSRVRVR
jgi:hypothetical protein